MTISALDESGKAVDWWFATKVPKLDGTGRVKTATAIPHRLPSFLRNRL